MSSRSEWLQTAHLRVWRSSEVFGADADAARESSSVFIGFFLRCGLAGRRSLSFLSGAWLPVGFFGGSSESAESRMGLNI